MFLSVKSLDSAPPGWTAVLMRHAGCKVTYRYAPFGRTVYFIEMDGEGLEIRQDKYRAATTPIEGLSPTQRKIVALLVATGVASERTEKP